MQESYGKKKDGHLTIIWMRVVSAYFSNEMDNLPLIILEVPEQK